MSPMPRQYAGLLPSLSVVAPRQVMPPRYISNFVGNNNDVGLGVYHGGPVGPMMRSAYGNPYGH